MVLGQQFFRLADQLSLHRGRSPKRSRNGHKLEGDTVNGVCHRLDRLDQYAYGRKVHIQNDHKPLATYHLEETAQPSIPPYPGTDDGLHRYDATDLPVCTEQPTFHCRHSEPCLSSSVILGSMFVWWQWTPLLDIPDKITQEVPEATQIMSYRHSYKSLTKDGQPGKVTFLNPSVRTLTSMTRRVIKTESS